ncbi:hypothetical protein BTM29_11695 [Companilactobacillus allii]|uniref:Glycosyltransferase RgtA/B/C/D-like domain-containing protein n=1 Tax=Companilactobacillus allii TaxID=1847728 RepID=A0A1P8Q6E4_9LACO|nr:hypothetical protein BTM29_11695 [Companilactobacillus allii]
MLVKFSDYISPALLATILAAIISGVLLFVSPIHGYADNGDFYRAMLTNSIYRLPYDHTSTIDYVVTKFGIYQYFNENGMIAFSSQTIFIQIALFFNKIFYSTKFFDIRFLGAVYYVFYLGAIYLLTKSFVYPYKRVRSYMVALLVVLVFADSSFTLYFNSFFAEPVMYIFMLYGFAAIMLLAKGSYKRNWPMITLFFVSIILLITDKSQNAPLALSFSAVSIGMMFLPHFRARRFAIMLGMFVLMGTGVFTYTAIKKEFNDVNQYQSFTHGVLMDTGDPSKKIEKQGMDEQFALLREEDYYPKTYTVIKVDNGVIQKKLLPNNGIGWTLKYYAHNPKQFGVLMDLASQDIMITQVKAVGDYIPSSHKPSKQLRYFTTYSQFMGAFFPGKFAFIIMLLIGLISCYSVGLYMDLREKRPHGVVRFFLVFGLCTIVFFVPIIAIVGDGDADLAKHIFMTPLSLDLMFVLFISDVLHHRLWDTSPREEFLDEAK